MSSYHSSFTYKEINSAKDKNLIVVSFDPDDEFKDTFLSMDPVYEDSYDGAKRFDYGAKYNSTATITIDVIRNDGSAFSLDEVRSCLRWLTGSKINSWLDMYDGETFKYSFLGRVTNVQQRKMDARTIGLQIEFTSVSPWAYSEEQHFELSIGDDILYTVDSEDEIVVTRGNNAITLNIDENGVVYNSPTDENSYFLMTDDGVVHVDNAARTHINNQTDNLYTYINLDVDYVDGRCDNISIKNTTLNEETIITGMTNNEIITMSSHQFIVSYGVDKDGNRIQNTKKIFGDTFNFVWPRLAPGINNLVVDGPSDGSIKFSYRYPMKVGDCTMDVDEYGSGIEPCANVK